MKIKCVRIMCAILCGAVFVRYFVRNFVMRLRCGDNNIV